MTEEQIKAAGRLLAFALEHQDWEAAEAVLQEVWG